MTEQEAKTKWCPMARQLDWRFDEGRVGGELQAVSGAVNRGSEDKPVAFCIGSACMAWRWDRLDDLSAAGMSEKERSRVVGHCGLAGKP